MGWVRHAMSNGFFFSEPGIPRVRSWSQVWWSSPLGGERIVLDFVVNFEVASLIARSWNIEGRYP